MCKVGNKDFPQPVVIVGNGIGTCPNCGADIHGMGMIERCPVCNQAIDWNNHVRRKKDSTGLSGGKLW